MSTAVLSPPAPAGGTGRDGGGPARRAVVRWAWRLFRREWRQQYLVLLLLTLSVAAVVLGAAVAVNLPPPAQAGFGTAQHLATLPGDDPHLTSDIAAIQQQVGTVDIIASRRIATGTVQGAELRAQDPHGAYGAAMLSLLSGRYPSAAGEVALTPKLADTYRVGIGGSWDGGGTSYRVVGLVENPQNLLDVFALVAPGQLSTPTRVAVLFDSSDDQASALTFPHGGGVLTPAASAGLSPALVALLVAVVGLVFVGLVAVAGFSVLAQRRRRALGVLSALGATERHLQLVMIANGAAVGVAAALVGTALGFAAWLPYAPQVQESSHHRVSWTHVPWWLDVTIAVLAVVTAVLAAVRPARVAAHLSAVAAISGRPAPPKPVHRSAWPGSILLGAGLVLLAFSGGWGAGTGKDTLFKLGGLIGLVAGIMLFAPACLTVLGRLAGRTPVAARLALRDLARYRARSGPALAAITFAIFIAVFVSLLATGRFADPLDYFGPNLSANQVMLYPPGQNPAGGPNAPTGGPDAPTGQPSAAAVQGVATSIAASIGTQDVLALDTTDVILAQASNAGGVQALMSYGGMIFVATPSVLRHYGIDPATIAPDALLITSRPGLDRSPNLRLLSGVKPREDECQPSECVADPKIQQNSALPLDASGPNLLVTQHALDVLHLTSHPGAWLIQAGQALTSMQINSARQLAAASALTIETKSQAPSLAEIRDDATYAGILVALAVLAMTVGLVRSEAGRDLQTLAANGANGRTRRTIAATTAGALGLTGALVGTVIAYAGSVALFRSQLSERMHEVPVLDLVLIVLGLPAIAIVGSWLLGGGQPAALGRQRTE